MVTGADAFSFCLVNSCVDRAGRSHSSPALPEDAKQGLVKFLKFINMADDLTRISLQDVLGR